ncbi:MAG: ABC transporter ATP-binding protein [Bacilli bacterium]|nr:ABC transporter ATP-binding protein [Bacilli bacterium]
MAIVEIKNLKSGYIVNKEYVPVFNDFNLEIEENKITAILGPNGCGKTTLLKIIAGLHFYEEGDVILDNKSVEKIPIQKRDLSYIAQDIALFPHWSVFENIAYPLRSHKVKAAEIFKKVEDIAKEFEIEHLLSRNPSELSLGQQQKVILARAIIRDAKLYLFDEPFSNIDEENKQVLLGFLKKEKEKRNLSIIFVTHKLQDIFAIADNLVVMNKGQNLQSGKLDEVLKHPNSFETLEILKEYHEE